MPPVDALEASLNAADMPIQAMGLLSLDGSLFAQLALFLVLMAVLNKLLFKPALEAVALREERTVGTREAADRAREEAEDKVADFERRLSTAKRDAADVRRRLREAGAAQRQELVDAARTETNEILDSSRGEIEEAAREARKQVDQAAERLSGQIVARLLGTAAAIALVVGWAGDAWAAGGAPQSAGDFLKGAGFAAINFALLMFIFVKFGRPGIRSFLKGRRDEITRELEEARRLRDEAQALLDDYSGKLDGIDAEREELLAQFKATGEEEKARLIEEGKAQAERMREDARRTIDREVRRVSLEVRDEVLDKAVRQATERLRGDVGPAEQKTLVQDFLGRVRNMSGGAA